jgi:hypothetical protein
MRINRIATDSQGFKILSAEKERPIKGKKPVFVGHTFFDYKDGILREFAGSGFYQTQVLNFKHALRLIFSK